MVEEAGHGYALLETARQNVAPFFGGVEASGEAGEDVADLEGGEEGGEVGVCFAFGVHVG